MSLRLLLRSKTNKPFISFFAPFSSFRFLIKFPFLTQTGLKLKIKTCVKCKRITNEKKKSYIKYIANKICDLCVNSNSYIIFKLLYC